MSSSRTFRDRLAPWAGLTVGLIAWAIAHQFGSDGLFDDCAAFAPGPLLAVALIAIVTTAIAGLLSWRAFKAERTAEAQRVIAIISVGTAALFCLAMLYPVLAAIIIPPCFM